MISGKSDCGMLYGIRKSGTATGYCALSIRCGTRDEDGFHSGIAHFTEHTIFKGTAHKSASVINSYLDRLGGDLNAFTNNEEIVLHAMVLKEDLPKAISLLLELATCTTFPEDEIETERGVVIEEILSYKDSPADDIYDCFQEKFFKGHPLSRRILGTVASVKKISPEELRRFVAEKFRPEAMALTVVSPEDETVTEKKVRRLIDKYFHGHEAGGQIAGIRPVMDGKSHFLPVPAVFDQTSDKKNHEVNAIIGGMAPSMYQEKERLAAILLCNILAGPFSNTMLNSVLREKNGWVYGVEGSYTQFSDSGLMTIGIGCEKDNLEKCFRTIGRTLEKMRTVPLSETRLKAAKRQILGQLAISSDNGEAMCLSMGKSLLSFGRISSDEEDRASLMAVTAEEIRQAACSIFDPERISRLVFL